MTLSRVIMVFSLAVLAYILFNTVSEENKTGQSENFSNKNAVPEGNMSDSTASLAPVPAPEPSVTSDNEINYENFEAVPAVDELAAAPVTQTVTVEEAEDDGLQIESTDALIAPQADRFTGVNSIAQVNKNASHDLRGDYSAIPYNNDLSPWMNSASQGDPIQTNRLQ